MSSGIVHHIQRLVNVLKGLFAVRNKPVDDGGIKIHLNQLSPDESILKLSEVLKLACTNGQVKVVEIIVERRELLFLIWYVMVAVSVMQYFKPVIQ